MNDEIDAERERRLRERRRERVVGDRDEAARLREPDDRRDVGDPQHGVRRGLDVEDAGRGRDRARVRAGLEGVDERRRHAEAGEALAQEAGALGVHRARRDDVAAALADGEDVPLIAAIPLAVAAAVSLPSSAASFRSSASTVGFPHRP